MPSTSDLNQNDPLAGSTDSSTPVIAAEDFFESNNENIVARVRDACLDPGFLIIEPTADMQATIAGTIDRMQAFFSLDDEDPSKQEVRQDGSRNGWRPRYTEPAYQPGTVSSLEAFDIGRGEINSTRDNDWPDIPEFRTAVTGCWNQYLLLADAVLELVSSAAGLDRDFLVSRCQTRELNSFRLLHYAANPQTSNYQDVGISAHTDFECITLLYQDAPGLELRTTKGDWVDAEIGTGRIVVMLDDMLERWTNRCFTATGHRVRQTSEQRFSIVMFMAVDDGLSIAPLDRFVSESNPAKFVPVTQVDHLNAEIRRARKNAELTQT